jgi:hypothetical protein
MDAKNETKSGSQILILLVSGSCCFPKLAVLDKQAQEVIQQAQDESGVPAQVRVILASSALQGGIPEEILKQLRDSMDSPNLMRLPATFIDGKLLSFGVPDFAMVKARLLEVYAAKMSQKG